MLFPLFREMNEKLHQAIDDASDTLHPSVYALLHIASRDF